MNELQIKITADVKDIQSALSRVKKTLKEFEDSMASSSDVANGKLERQKGIIEQLNAKVNEYKTSITRALSEQEIAKYNAKLQDTQKDLARLNALGKVFEQTSVKVQEQTGLIGQLSAKLKELKSSLQQATTEKEVERLNIELAQTSKELTRISSLGKVFKTTNVEVQQQNGLIGKLNSQLKQLKVSLQQATSEEEVARLNSELAQTSAELSRINSLGKNITAPAVKSFTQLKSSVGAANGSAIAFNRIIQDAPFGLLGVGNNIQQFTEQISFLKQSTGSTGAALKTFFSSLITPTNLLILGVSALTSGLTAYQMGAFDSAEETKDLRSETDIFNESLSNVVKNLNAVNSARLQGNKGASDELVELELLNSVLNDNSKSESERIRAYNLLLEKYPKIIKNISDEKKLVEGLGESYNLLVNAIGERAKAIAVEEKLVEISKERFDILQKEQNEVKLQNDLIKRRIDLEKKEADARIKINAKETKQADRNQALRDLSDAKAALKKLKEETNNFGIISQQTNNALIKNDESITNLKDAYKNLDFALISILDPLKETESGVEGINRVFDLNILSAQRFSKETENAKKRIEELLSIKPEKLIETDLQIDESKLEGLEQPLKQDPGIIEGLQKQIESFEKLKQVTSDPTMLALYTLQIGLLKNKLAEFNGEEVKSNLQLIADAFGSMGQQIANSLNISNRSLRGFVTTLVSATPKIVAAILAKSKATVAGAKTENLANAQLAAGNSVVVATEGAKGLGPVGLALLPVFIAGALALVSSAFGKAGGGGGSASPGQGSTFTNRREFGGPVSKGRAYIVGEKRPELFVPNTNGIIIPQLPSMDYSGASVNPSVFGVDVRLKGPDDLLFFVEQAQIRRGIR
jgi:chromosome segregation ATPase